MMMIHSYVGLPEGNNYSIHGCYKPTDNWGPTLYRPIGPNAEAIAVSTLHLAGFHSLYSVIFLRYSELLKVMVSQWYPNCLALFSHERFVVFFPTVVGGKDLPFMASLGKKNLVAWVFFS